MNATNVKAAANSVEVFKNDELGSIRTVMINDIPFFAGKDVAEILGYTNPQKAVRDHVDPEDIGVNEMDTPGGRQQMQVINESGLYSLILSSKLPAAKKFKHWVTSDVLPAIRKKGYYVNKGYNVTDNITREEIAMYFTFFIDSLKSYRVELDKRIETLANIISERDAKFENTISLLAAKPAEAIVQKPEQKTYVKMSDESKEWLRKAWDSARIISRKSGKSEKQSFIEAYAIAQKNGTDLKGMYQEYLKTHPKSAKINMCSESAELRACMEEAFRELHRKYYPNLYIKRRNISTSVLLVSTPPFVRECIQKVAKRNGMFYNRAALEVYKEIERRTGANLKAEAKAYALSRGYANCKKAYYITTEDKYFDVLKQIAEGK